MAEPISIADLEKYLWGAAVLLRGQIDASGYKEFIFPLLFFKRICDVFSSYVSVGIVFYPLKSLFVKNSLGRGSGRMLVKLAYKA